MPPKVVRTGWKTGEQLEFLISRWPEFKRAQDKKALSDQFWPKVFEDWHNRWPVSASPSSVKEHGSTELARLMLQSDNNGKIKQWFNNRCRGSDSGKGGRGELKLDLGEKRKLAAVQAYCTYAWDTLRPIVLTRWDQQKKSDTFDDDEDPPEDADTVEERIPLSFKLKIAKEVYESLPMNEKKKIDKQREQDRERMYCRVCNIDDDDYRIRKLEIHKRNQPMVAKSLLRVLMNLEEQTGCIAQVLVASVDPAGGSPSIQKFCQGKTAHDLNFETFCGKEWSDNMEKKFGEWSVRVFGEKGTERRNKFLFKPDTEPEASSSGSKTTSEASSSEFQIISGASSSQNPSTEATAAWKSSSRPSRSRKSGPQPSISKGSKPQPPTTHPSLSALASHTSAGPPPSPDQPNPDGDMVLAATAIGVHQLLVQAAAIPLVFQAPTSNSPSIGEQSHLVASPSQLTVEPPQLTVDPPQSHLVASQPHLVASQPHLVASQPQLIIEPPQITVDSSQSAIKHSTAPGEVVLMDIQPDSSVTPMSSQTLTEVDATPHAPTPRAPYRVRSPKTINPGKPSRRDSIDGAPEIVVDVVDNQREIVVDLREYINLEIDDGISHVSSSQKTADQCRELSPPPPDPQSHASTTTQPRFASTRTLPQLDIDSEDLPAWMTKKGQWKYVASAAGGAAWENLLRVYMNQERRLEFSETGVTLTTEGRPLKIKEYFQYAHQPSRGDTLRLPNFGLEVTEWWGKIQPDWRRTNQAPGQWSYILSGGSKGAFLVILCLAWWDRAYERYLEEQRETHRAKAEAAGNTKTLGNLPDHDAEWLKIVNDIAFVMQKAQDSEVPTRGMPSPSRKAKRKHEVEPSTPRKRSASLRTRSKT